MELFKSVINVETALETAVSLEKAGRDFYKKKLNITDDPGLRDILSFLASEDENHLATYTAILREVTGKNKDQQLEFSDEHRMYVNMLVSEIIIWLKEEIPETVDQITKISINLEKNTLLFFQEIKLLLTGSDYDTVDAICREEKNHILKIAAFRKSRFNTGGNI